MSAVYQYCSVLEELALVTEAPYVSPTGAIHEESIFAILNHMSSERWARIVPFVRCVVEVLKDYLRIDSLL